MTTQFIELETINDQELQAADGGGLFGAVAKPFTKQMAKTVDKELGKEAGGVLVGELADALF